jgi:hypothetical protein
MSNSTTEPRAGALLSDIIHARMTGRLGDLLLLWFDAGVSYGMGLPLELPADETTSELLGETIARWHRESQAAQSWHDASVETQDFASLPADDIPGWLLSLPRQVVPPEEQ